mgnify:CR=1 FL=1
MDFCSALEMSMRAASVSVTGRDHISYRGYFLPSNECVDGDLCEGFASDISQPRQAAIAEEMNRTPGEITKKLEDFRNSIL